MISVGFERVSKRRPCQNCGKPTYVASRGRRYSSPCASPWAPRRLSHNGEILTHAGRGRAMLHLSSRAATINNLCWFTESAESTWRITKTSPYNARDLTKRLNGSSNSSPVSREASIRLMSHDARLARRSGATPPKILQEPVTHQSYKWI